MGGLLGGHFLVYNLLDGDSNGLDDVNIFNLPNASTGKHGRLPLFGGSQASAAEDSRKFFEEP